MDTLSIHPYEPTIWIDGGSIIGIKETRGGMMNKTYEPIKVNELGMELDKWKYKSCSAYCGVGEDWATVYDIESLEESRGHATKLILIMKKYYQDKGLKFGGSVALNNRMRRIYQRCDVKEYTEIP